MFFCISIDLHIRKTFFFKKSLSKKKKKKNKKKKKKKKKEEEKIKKQNACPCKFHKTLKGSSFHCQKCADQIYL